LRTTLGSNQDKKHYLKQSQNALDLTLRQAGVMHLHTHSVVDQIQMMFAGLLAITNQTLLAHSMAQCMRLVTDYTNKDDLEISISNLLDTPMD
jgi:hypothetical protein